MMPEGMRGDSLHEPGPKSFFENVPVQKQQSVESLIVR
jgi:hypothetical protein